MKLVLQEEVRRRFKAPRGGGRATDPEWTVSRLVRLKPATLEKLEQTAPKLAEPGRPLSPMQLAALLIERGLELLEE